MAPRTRPPLHVWLYGEHLGTLTSPSFQRLRFEPDDGVTRRWPLGSTVLSVALPFNGRTPNGVPVRAFFEGLLPEGEARTVLEREFGVARGDSFGLLTELGRDCAGAVTLTPDDATPDDDAGHVEPMTDADLVEAVFELSERPLGASAEVRVSLAGQQDKLLLHRDDAGRFGRPVGGAATNVLLKPEPTNFPGYAANEAYCMRLARDVGLTTVNVEVLDVAGRPVLVVPRYDRAGGANGRARRLHQEDLCQALAVDCALQDRKYERDGGPTLLQVAGVLDRHGLPGDRRRLLAYTTFHVVVGNADAHGKNVSLLHHPDGQAELAPMYDVSSTVRYEFVETPTGRRRLSTEMGMRVNGQTSMQQVRFDDLVAEGRRWGLTATDAETVVRRTVDDVHAAARSTWQKLGAPDEELVLVVEDRAKALLGGLAAASLTPQDVAKPSARRAMRRELRSQLS